MPNESMNQIIVKMVNPISKLFGLYDTLNDNFILMPTYSAIIKLSNKYFIVNKETEWALFNVERLVFEYHGLPFLGYFGKENCYCEICCNERRQVS